MCTVKVCIRSKSDDSIFSVRTMERPDAINFTAMWDFAHSESNYYVRIEELMFDGTKSVQHQSV
jgi:hypothetical protein